MKKAKRYQCSQCHQTGHNTTTCGKQPYPVLHHEQGLPPKLVPKKIIHHPVAINVSYVKKPPLKSGTGYDEKTLTMWWKLANFQKNKKIDELFNMYQLTKRTTKPEEWARFLLKNVNHSSIQTFLNRIFEGSEKLNPYTEKLITEILTFDQNKVHYPHSYMSPQDCLYKTFALDIMEFLPPHIVLEMERLPTENWFVLEMFKKRKREALEEKQEKLNPERVMSKVKIKPSTIKKGENQVLPQKDFDLAKKIIERCLKIDILDKNYPCACPQLCGVKTHKATKVSTYDNRPYFTVHPNVYHYHPEEENANNVRMEIADVENLSTFVCEPTVTQIKYAAYVLSHTPEAAATELFSRTLNMSTPDAPIAKLLEESDIYGFQIKNNNTYPLVHHYAKTICEQSELYDRKVTRTLKGERYKCSQISHHIHQPQLDAYALNELLYHKCNLSNKHFWTVYPTAKGEVSVQPRIGILNENFKELTQFFSSPTLERIKKSVLHQRPCLEKRLEVVKKCGIKNVAFVSMEVTVPEHPTTVLDHAGLKNYLSTQGLRVDNSSRKKIRGGLASIPQGLTFEPLDLEQIIAVLHRTKDDTFTLLDGHKRLAKAYEMGKKEIKVIVVE